MTIIWTLCLQTIRTVADIASSRRQYTAADSALDQTDWQPLRAISKFSIRTIAVYDPVYHRLQGGGVKWPCWVGGSIHVGRDRYGRKRNGYNTFLSSSINETVKRE